MGTVGVQEMVVIFILALVLFGPKKLPELGRTIGKAISEFRRASSDLKATFEREMHALERETESLKEATHSVAGEIKGQTDWDPFYDETGNVTAWSDPVLSAPYTVGAPEIPGAELQGTVSDANHAAASHEAAGQTAGSHESAGHEQAAEATPAVEGTVPRKDASRTEVTEDPAARVETPQHS